MTLRDSSVHLCNVTGGVHTFSVPDIKIPERQEFDRDVKYDNKIKRTKYENKTAINGGAWDIFIRADNFSRFITLIVNHRGL